MKRIASRAAKTLISLSVAVLVICAVFVAITRELVYQVDDFQLDIIQALNQHTDLHVEFVSIIGSWQGLAPRFQLRDVTLRLSASAGTPVTIASVDLEILLLKSLLHLQPRFRLHLDGVKGQAVYRDQHIVVSGFENIGQPGGDRTENSAESVIDFLISQPKISLTNSHVTVAGLYEQPVDFEVQRFQSEAGLRRRYLLGNMTAHGPSTLDFELKGRVNGSVLQKGSLSGSLYFNVENADWYPWIPPAHRGFSQANLESLKGGTQIWLSLKNGLAQEIISQFKINDIKFTSSNEFQAPELLNLQGKARWAGVLGDQWQLDLQDMRMQTTRFLWLPSVVHIRSDQETSDKTRLRVSVDDVDIDPWVNYYLSIQSADDKLHQTLSKLRPSGKLQQVALELFVQDKAILDYRFALTLAAFENRPWQFFPGFHDLDVRAWGRKGKYFFNFNEQYLELNYPRLFRDVLRLNTLKANLSLQVLDDQYFLQSDTIKANTRDVQSATQLSLILPKDKEQSPFIQLQSTLRNADGKNTSTYLPAGVIDDALVRWLDGAIIDGHLLRGDILAHGPVRKNEIEPRAVILGFTAEHAVLQFQPDWQEPVRNAVADVVVDRGEVSAQILQASYFDQQLIRGSVALPRYQPGQPHVLSVRAKTQGKAEQGFDILKKTPLKGFIGEFIEEFQLGGDMNVDFALDVPLQKEFRHQMQANAAVALANAEMTMESQNIQVSDMTAEVSFSLDKGLSAQHISGSFLDGRVSGVLKTDSRKSGQMVKLALHGDAPVKRIKAWKPMSVLEPLSGQLKYDFLLSVPLGKQAQQSAAKIDLTSNLAGVKIDLPAPFGKTADTKRPLSLTLGLSSEPFDLRVHYNDLLDVALRSGADGLQKGSIRFGPGEAQLPDKKRLVILGELPRFDSSEWQPVISSLHSAAERNQENVDQRLMYLIDDSALRVGDLTLMGFALGKTDLSLRRAQQSWELLVDNEMATGRLSLPDYLLGDRDQFAQQTIPIEVDLKRLHFEKQSADSQSMDVWQPVELSPLNFPPMDITLDQFSIADSNLGKWQIQMKPEPRGMELSRLQAEVSGVTLSGSGHWREQSNQQRSTQINASLKARDAADVIRAWGGTPTLSSKSAKAKAALQWPGAPFEFSLGRLQGRATAELGNGVFYNVSSNAAGKLWGALNFETLLRRLQLDFDDIRESEMVYDEIKGKFTLDRGKLALEEVRLNSPAIKMNARGNIDLSSDTLDVGLDVALPVTRNLVLPAAVIGGVPAAATAYVVEKIFGEQFDKLTTVKYQIKGTFEEPKVTVKDSFSIIPKQVGEAVIRNDNPETPKANSAPNESLKPLIDEVTP